MNDKLKFYRSTLVQMTKEAYKKLPNEMKVEEAVNYGDLLTKAIMKQCDEFADECFGETSNCCDPKFYITVDPRYNVTTTEEPMRTIVDNGPQYQANQKSYGTLGEHWKELMMMFKIKSRHSLYKISFNRFIINYKNKNIEQFKIDEKDLCFLYSDEIDDLVNIADSLGIEFIEDFVKACEKCENQ